MEEPGFWDNADKANNSMKELKNLKDTVEEYHRLETAWEDVETLLEMGYEENDASLIPEVQEAMADFEKRFEHLRIKTLLSEEYDGDNAIVTLHAGAGGTEACDWVSMLFRMYTRWAEKHGFTTTVLDYLDGEEAGIKSVTVEIAGENAYGYMRREVTVLSVFHHLMRRVNVRHPSRPAMLCRISRKILILRSMRMICELIRTVPAVPVVSISTRRHRPSVLHICRRILLCNVRMRDLSI